MSILNLDIVDLFFPKSRVRSHNENILKSSQEKLSSSEVELNANVRKNRQTDAGCSSNIMLGATDVIGDK